MRRDVLALGFVLAMVGSAAGQEPPCFFPRRDHVNAHISARVVQSGMTFNYDYMVENRLPATQRIVKFAVQSFTADSAPVTQTSPRD